MAHCSVGRVAHRVHPSTCLGMELAYLEARVALVELLREFRFEPVRTKDKDAFQYGVILTFKDGLPIKCIPRVCHKLHGTKIQR